MKDFFLTLWQNDLLRLTLGSAFKLVLAAICGGFIGYEREHSHRPAGFRTHILVAVGSALVMITSSFLSQQYEGMIDIDPTRMSAQVISGIGFLGAGTILREGFSVKGLTTAASLWAVSCVGIAVGSGFYVGALIATLVIYITLNLLKRVSARGNAGRNLYVEVEDVGVQASRVGKVIRRCGGDLASMELLNVDGEEGKRKKAPVLKILVYTHNLHELDLIVESIRAVDGVQDLYVE